MREKEILRGYDIDGTICEPPPKREKPYFKQTGDERLLHSRRIDEHIENAGVIMQPIPPYIVVTGRKEVHREATERWFEKNIDHQPVAIFMLQKSRTRANMIELKHEMCIQHGVSVYYEDDEKIAKELVNRGIAVVKV